MDAALTASISLTKRSVPLAPAPVQHLLRRCRMAHTGDNSHRARHNGMQHRSAASVGIQHGCGQACLLARGCWRERCGCELNRIAIDETEIPIRVGSALADPVYRAGNILVMARPDTIVESGRRGGTARSPRTVHKGGNVGSANSCGALV